MRSGLRVNGAAFAKLLGSWRTADDRQLASRLAERTILLIRDGRLPAGMQLPAERDLATALGISRTTIAAAYDQMRSQDVLDSRRGSGTWVAIEGSSRTTVTPWLPGGSGVRLDLSQAALPAPREIADTALPYAAQQLPMFANAHGYHLLGIPELRAGIAARFTQRGLPTSPDEVLVTTGAQQALTLALRCFVDNGSRVLVDHPTYPNALDAIGKAGGRAVPIGFGDEVWDVGLLRDSARNGDARLIYLVPDFHNPTGMRMTDADRESVGALAQRTATPLLVDETLTELSLVGNPPPPLASFVRGGQVPVVTVGSVSKVFWGGLRVGWLRGPAALVRRAAAIKATLDMSTPVLEQLITARLLQDLQPIAQRRRAELRVAQEHLARLLRELFPSWNFASSPGGLSLWVDLGRPLSSRLAAAASHWGVMVTPGPRFGTNGAFENYLRLPYTLPADDARQALDRLALAWSAVESGADMPTQDLA
jgi:DNA-binding transcriptional MocR family regulator